MSGDLFDAPPPAPAPRALHFLKGLSVNHPGFCRQAAERIAEMADAAEIEAAFAEVPPEFLQMVESLAVHGMASRIIAINSTAERAAALDALPLSVRQRVAARVAGFGLGAWRFPDKQESPH